MTCFSLLICSVYHELGHAVAAVTENVRVLGFGVFLLLFIPAAFVRIFITYYFKYFGVCSKKVRFVRWFV